MTDEIRSSVLLSILNITWQNTIGNVSLYSVMSTTLIYSALRFISSRSAFCSCYNLITYTYDMMIISARSRWLDIGWVLFFSIFMDQDESRSTKPQIKKNQVNIRYPWLIKLGQYIMDLSYAFKIRTKMTGLFRALGNENANCNGVCSYLN